jgi:hypothetical protein
VPGDTQMFLNPGANRPDLRNENTIYLGGGLYGGHGIGILTAKEMIDALNASNPIMTADRPAGLGILTCQSNTRSPGRKGGG